MPAVRDRTLDLALGKDENPTVGGPALTLVPLQSATRHSPSARGELC